EIERQIGVTYKCAWRICHELRKLMAAADDKWGTPFGGGHVEIDETLVGGRRKASEPENKTIVFGMLQRGGRLLAAPIPDVTIYTVEGIINENIPAGTKISYGRTSGLQRTKARLRSWRCQSLSRRICARRAPRKPRKQSRKSLVAV